VKGNLLWIAILCAACTVTWFTPHQFAPVMVMLGWVFGTWWGYLTAYGERP